MSYEPPAPPAPPPDATGSDMVLVATEWRRRTEAEYRSASIAQHVTLWLIQVGAPPDLIRDGLRVVEDELTHSELSAAVAGAAAGTQMPPVLDPAQLSIGSGGGPFRALAESVVRYFCIGETVAVPLFRMLRSRATVPAARQALDVVLRDESRHRQFGWDALDWLLLSHDSEIAPIVEATLPGMLRDVTRAYGAATGSDDTRWPRAIQAWGLAPPPAYAKAVVAAVHDDLAPRFAARGLSVS